jgi:hypothetical protein
MTWSPRICTMHRTVQLSRAILESAERPSLRKLRAQITNRTAGSAERNPGNGVDLRRVEANHFSAAGYIDGERSAWRRIFIGHGVMGNSITFSVLTSLVLRSHGLDHCRC